MSDHTDYKLEIQAPAGQDIDFIIFKMHKLAPDSKHYIDENGKSVGNGYDWREIEDDMKLVSRELPGVLFIFTEYGVYETSFEFRLYFKDGKSARIEPVITTTWPEFSEDMLK